MCHHVNRYRIPGADDEIAPQDSVVKSALKFFEVANISFLAEMRITCVDIDQEFKGQLVAEASIKRAVKAAEQDAAAHFCPRRFPNRFPS